MHKSESVLVNETHKVLFDFEIETDHLIPARRPDQVIINIKTENLLNGGLCHPSGSQRGIKIKRKERQEERGLEKLEIKERMKTIQTTALLR